ncbi:MAG: tetratricopeptide repeat protein [Cyanobacteriota bacterium]|nr:tetratricopeptide repeat protein [Cyanobacteriota bacterium]
MTKPQNAQEFIAQQRQAIAANPDCGTSHYNLAVALMGIEEYDEAEKELLEAVDCSPTLAEGYVQLGALCLRRGDLEGCLQWNQKAVKMRPGFSEGHGNIGFVHLQMGNVDEAIVSLKRATHFNFRYVQAFASLATAHLMKGEVEESIEASRQALKIDPNFPIAHNNLGIAYMEKGDFAAAIEHIDRARELGYEVAPQILEELKPHRSS